MITETLTSPATAKERPILFSASMVRAILDGSKTQTRRVIKPEPSPYWNPSVGLYSPTTISNGGYAAPGPEVFGGFDETEGRKCPYGQPGERLWVRETWLPDPHDDGTWAYTQFMGCKGSPLSDIPERFQKPEHCLHRATWSGQDLVWKPSIHMPRWASRINLEITGVRVERLQDISEADAKAEGIQPDEVRQMWLFGASADERAATYRRASVRPYQALWESINGPGSWEANPWVWVIEIVRAA